MQSDHRSNLPVSQELPREIVWIVFGLAIWLVLSVWGFAGSGYVGLALTVVSLFIGVAVGLPLLLSAIGRRRRSMDTDPTEPDTLKEWLRREFVAHSGTMRARTAAIEVLLPLAAVALGMTLFALVHHFDIGA